MEEKSEQMNDQTPEPLELLPETSQSCVGEVEITTPDDTNPVAGQDFKVDWKLTTTQQCESPYYWYKFTWRVNGLPAENTLWIHNKMRHTISIPSGNKGDILFVRVNVDCGYPACDFKDFHARSWVIEGP